MKDWLSHRQEYLDELLRHEGRGKANQLCPTCVVGVQGPRSQARYACRDCSSSRMFCHTCIVSQHVENPFHNIKVSIFSCHCHSFTDTILTFQEWVTTHWQTATLRSLGLSLQLGHPISEPCSRPVPANTLMAIVHTNGIHSVAISYCGCTSQAISHRQQLMRHRLYPGTVRKPKTCITFTAMETLHIQNVQSKCGIYDIYTSLERLTDNTGVVPIRVCPALLLILPFVTKLAFTGLL